MNWGYYIKRLREEAGLTQHQLAEKAGMKRSHISNIERGAYQSFRPDILKCLAYGLGRSTSELVDLIYSVSAEKAQETPEQILERLKIAQPIAVPVYEDFPFHAGAATEPAEHVYQVRDKARGKNLEGYIARGRCLEPQIGDGDIIVVDRDVEPDINNIVACLYRGELWLGRLRRIAGELWIENNEHRFKIEESPIVAPVIEVRRRLK